MTDLHITGPNGDGEYWLHIKAGGKMGGINLGSEHGPLAHRLLDAASIEAPVQEPTQPDETAAPPALLAERDDMATLWQQAEMGLASALAERDAALAEVTRMSTPPDDAEVLAIIKDVTFEAVNSEIDRVLAGRICQKLARLSHALAAETAKREAMEEALTGLLKPFEDDPCRYDHHGKCQEHFIEDDCCVARARATLAKHGKVK